MRVPALISRFACLLSILGYCSTHDSSTCKYVTIPLCGDQAVANFLSGPDEVRIATGPPGKAGAKGGPGIKGSRGETGQKGEKGERTDMQAVEELIDEKLSGFFSNVMGMTGTDVCKKKSTAGVLPIFGESFLCDGLGWTVIQKRLNGSVDFERTWTEYATGFGSLNGEFWMGLSAIHKLTRDRQCKIRFELGAFGGDTAYAEYSSFSIADEEGKFKLSISGYSGNAGDSMVYHNGMLFTTKDQHNDLRDTNCSPGLGGWWYKRCFHVSVNGVWGRSSGRWKNILWYTWKGAEEALEKTTVKIQCS